MEDVMGVEVWGNRKVLTTLGDAPLLILVLHGGMAGILSGMALRRLQEMGVTPDAHNVKAICGFSAGAGNALGWCGGKAHEITDVYAHLAERSHGWLGWFHQTPFDPAQVGYLVHYLEQQLGSTLPQQTSLYIGVTNWQGQGICLRAQDNQEELFDLCAASAWLPLPMQQSAVNLSIGRCVDGACGFNPVGVINATRPRHVLILGNRPLDGEPIEGEFCLPEAMIRMGLGLYPSGIVDGVMSVDSKLKRWLKRLSALKHIRAVGLFPDHQSAVRWNEFRTDVIRERSDAYYQAVSNVLA